MSDCDSPLLPSCVTSALLLTLVLGCPAGAQLIEVVDVQDPDPSADVRVADDFNENNNGAYPPPLVELHVWGNAGGPNWLFEEWEDFTPNPPRWPSLFLDDYDDMDPGLKNYSLLNTGSPTATGGRLFSHSASGLCVAGIAILRFDASWEHRAVDVSPGEQHRFGVGGKPVPLVASGESVPHGFFLASDTRLETIVQGQPVTPLGWHSGGGLEAIPIGATDVQMLASNTGPVYMPPPADPREWPARIVSIEAMVDLELGVVTVWMGELGSPLQYIGGFKLIALNLASQVPYRLDNLDAVKVDQDFGDDTGIFPGLDPGQDPDALNFDYFRQDNLEILHYPERAVVHCGDVNKSGVVDILDALLQAQYALGLPQAPDIDLLGDVNRSGSVSLADALLVANWSNGPRDAALLCPGPEYRQKRP